MTDRVKRQVAPWLPTAGIIIATLLALGTISNVLRINRANAELRQQALAGQRARVTQCHTFPVAIKLYTAGERYGLITAADLQTYLNAAPRGCPPSK